MYVPFFCCPRCCVLGLALLSAAHLCPSPDNDVVADAGAFRMQLLKGIYLVARSFFHGSKNCHKRGYIVDNKPPADKASLKRLILFVSFFVWQLFMYSYLVYCHLHAHIQSQYSYRGSNFELHQTVY
jgi:hypothetical protein